MTVIENLEFYSEVYQIPEKISRDKIKNLLEFSNLTNHSYKLADQLSGGMKQKLALACNLIHTPKYLFLDEPTIGVDPVARRELWKILFDLRNQGVTIFVSTPYMDEAERCDEIGLMDKGKIIINNKPENIIKEFNKHILCIYSYDNHSIKDMLQGLEFIEDAYLLGDELHIVTEDLNISQRKLDEILTHGGIKINSMIEIEPSLEDVFVNIVKSSNERR
ncbi:ABC transporter ATP-binding protein [Peptoclostridium acidaminophilum]|uniref:ABC transporter ATP-binding protein n=1 Tax=Peptoclostridium acidaminophilum TaxID=1731 RepID=UPI002418BB40|nr:ATP-binding cassette domain-containing protein [Peptoclostridium acidaminophilum]